MLAVFTGRFAPLHKGHQMTIDAMTKENGIENCLILIGSSNSYTERTPYTFEQRREMIMAIYPKIKTLPLPDVKPELKHFDGTTNTIWLERIKKIEKDLNTKFIFYGGSKEDLEILATTFETRIPIDRNKKGLNISATLVREALGKNDTQALKRMVDPRILNLVIMGYNTFHGKRS